MHKIINQSDINKMLSTAIEEAESGLKEGGIPIGAALFEFQNDNYNLLGKGHNRRVQNDDPSVHGETDAFRNAGRQTNYQNKIMVTTLSPCWYCSGLIKQFKIGTVIIGENQNFIGASDWLEKQGVKIYMQQSQECISLLKNYIDANPHIWNEDIGES